MMRYSIYPKQFRNSRVPIEKNRCFVLMPFSSDFDLIYGEIKQYLLNNDFVCTRADELFGSVPIMSRVLNGILQAHFVIADLTGQNANVFYELGVAHSFKDAHNIILVSQNIEDIPFDIRHLNTITYSEDNIKYLTSSILKAIRDNLHYYNFFEALQKSHIIGSIYDNKYDFLEILQDQFGGNISIVTDVLNGNTERYSEDDIKQILDSCLGSLYSAAAGSFKMQLKGIMNVLSAMLCQCEGFSYAYEVVNHILHNIKLENYPIEHNEIIYLQAELAVSLASNKVFFNEAISWIVEYFSKSKSATVDLNRYSLERFLLTAKDINVDTAIVNSIMHESCYVREHMADMIGEKKISSGIEVLIMQLGREDNIYATSSIITALGKLGDRKAFPSIVEWFSENQDKVLRTQHYFILKHIYLALSKLNSSDAFTEKFQKEYAEHITPNAIF